MQMPETAVDQNNFLKPGEDQIGFTRKVFPVKSKPITHCMRQASNDHFRFGVLAMNPGHAVASLIWRQNIRH